ncbi:MAG TPA: gamma-glutamylcyclotransferase [Acidimicrobiales bacterium]|nr:gamma-glutamylcyclotransferase [Acidimicrobiales bacterium]
MAETPTRLFVYGTLMPGQERWPVLLPYARSSEPATARGQLWDTGVGYPAARFDDTGRDFPGALVTIAAELLTDVVRTLDRIEGEGVLFRRVEISTSAGPAFSYEWIGPTEGLSPLPNGWLGRAGAYR